METEEEGAEEMNQKFKRGVGIMIVKDGKVLLGKRCEGWASGTWTLPGGKVREKETYEDAAKREAEEETGLRVDKLKIVSVDYNKIAGKDIFKTLTFQPEIVEGNPVAKEPDQIERWEWFAPGSLPEPLYIPTKKVLDKIFK